MISQAEIQQAMFGASLFEDYPAPKTENTALYWDEEDNTPPPAIATGQALSTELALLIVAANFYLYTRSSFGLHR